MIDSLRKGFKLFLLSFGVSAPAKKPRPRSNNRRAGRLRQAMNC